MRKLFLSVGCALILLATATVSDAADRIFVTITDGTTPRTADIGSLRLSKPSVAPPPGTTNVTDTLTVLSCSWPCQVGFPSGSVPPAPADTFIFEHASSASAARVEKFDSGASADRVSLKGIKITSRVAGRVLTVNYGTEAGALRVLTSTQAASYNVTAAMSGSFRVGTSLTKASACKLGTLSTDMDTAIEACVRLSVAFNGTTVNGQGNTVSTTVSVPCNSSFPTVNPCGGGLWTPSNGGSFTGITDGKSISCPSTCSPVQVGTLVARFNGTGEVLLLTASTHGALSNVTDENGGVEETALALASEIGANRWVTFSAATERCRAEFKAPAINATRNINDQSNIPISTEYWCGILSPATQGVPLVSLGDTMLLPGAAGTRYEASRVAFLPAAGQLQLKNITALNFAYDLVVGPESNPFDSRLGPLTYSPCKDGSLRLEIQLLDSKGVDLGALKVYLGNIAADNFKSCDELATSLISNIVTNPDARVDPSGLLENLDAPCCVTFANAKSGQLGKFLVRKIAFIVSRPVSPALDPDEPFFDNFKVTFHDGTVTGNGITVSAQSSLQVVTGVTRSLDLSTNGVSFVITKLSSPTDAELGIVKVIRSTDIVINGGKFTTSVNVNDIQPESGAQYGISLCPNGAETDFAPDGPGDPAAHAAGDMYRQPGHNGTAIDGGLRDPS